MSVSIDQSEDETERGNVEAEAFSSALIVGGGAVWIDSSLVVLTTLSGLAVLTFTYLLPRYRQPESDRNE